MNFLARMVRFIFWVLIVSWVVKIAARLLGRALQSAAGENRQQQPGDRAEAGIGSAASAGESRVAARQLVRDPVCGMHLAETLAIPFRDRGELLHFCSVECRDKYANENLRRAANG